MIRLADRKDIPALMQIWRECFNDSQEYIDFFYQNRFLQIPTFVNEVEGEVAAMVTLFPGQVVKPQSSYHVQYVYALATKKSLQGRGYATKVLDYVVSHPIAEGALTILVPADEQLFSFYTKLGFHTVGYKKTVTLSRNALNIESLNSTPVIFSELTAQQYVQFRKETFLENGYLYWDEDSISYLLSEFRFCKGQAACAQVNEKAGAVLSYFDSVAKCLYIKETTFRPKDMEVILSALLKQYPADRVKLILSGIGEDYGYPDIECKPYVMIHSTSVARFPYANLMKD